MIDETVVISPEVLRVELEDLRGVDWSSIWDGPPHPGTPDVQRWCDRYGWKALTAEYDLDVETRHGNTLYLQAKGFWHPVVSMKAELWMASTASPDLKAETVSRGVASWTDYLRQAVGVMGEPSWVREAGSEDYPEPPYDGLWGKPESPQANPYRLACWDFRASGAHGLIVLLKQSVSRRTWNPGGGAGSNIAISFNPSQEMTRG